MYVLIGIGIIGLTWMAFLTRTFLNYHRNTRSRSQSQLYQEIQIKKIKIQIDEQEKKQKAG